MNFSIFCFNIQSYTLKEDPQLFNQVLELNQTKLVLTIKEKTINPEILSVLDLQELFNTVLNQVVNNLPNKMVQDLSNKVKITSINM
mgnify:CR=1 FL=1